MASPHAIHHINFIVRDLDAAVVRYRQAFGVDDVIWGDLPQRGVRTARFMLGGTWIALVQPTRDDGMPARHLRERGEGVFLVSLAVDKLDDAVTSVLDAGLRMLDAEPRSGLEGWKIQDLEPDDFFGVRFQFTEAARVPDGEPGAA